MLARVAFRLVCPLALLSVLHGCSQKDSSGQEPTPDAGVPDGGRVIDPLCTAPPDPAPPEPTDVASRLVSATAEFQRLQCECAVGFGAYVCTENCEADLFKLEPNGDVQCLRDLLATTLDEPVVECQLGVIEDLSECVAAASCDEDAFLGCAVSLEVGLAQCPPSPQGFEALIDGCFDRSGDRLTELYSESLDAAFEEACRCADDDAQRELCLAAKQDPRVDCLGVLTDLEPLARAVTECLIEYLDEETEFLADEVCCEDPEELDCRNASTPIFGSEAFGFRGPLDACSSAGTSEILYSATGTLADAMGGDAAGLDQAKLVIRVQADPAAAPTATSSTAASEAAEWDATASYTITNRPDGDPDLVFAGSTKITALNRFPIDPNAPPLPEPYDSFGFDVSSGVIEGVEVDLPFARAEFNGNELYDDRGTPNLRSLPPFSPSQEGGALTDASGDGAFAYDFSVERVEGDPVPVVDVSKAIAFCMGPEAPPPFDTSSDAGRCGEDPDLLVSGGLGDFITVSRSEALRGDGTPYVHFLVIRRDDISQLEDVVKDNPSLAGLDPVRQLIIALEFLDQSVDDSCETSGIISVALPTEVGTPPDFGEVAALIEDAQQKIEELKSINFDEIQQQLIEAIVAPIKSAACGAARGVVNVVIKPTNFKKIIANQAVKIGLGCPG